MKTNNPARHSLRSLLKPLLAIAAAAVFVIIPAAAQGQIFVSGGKGNNVIGKYNLNGSPVNASLISAGLDTPEFIAVSESNLFVMNVNSGILGKVHA